MPTPNPFFDSNLKASLLIKSIFMIQSKGILIRKFCQNSLLSNIGNLPYSDALLISGSFQDDLERRDAFR